MQEYSFKLHEHPKFGWSPRLSHAQFNELLSNVVEIRIRATYSNEGVGVIDDVALESAVHHAGRESTSHIEKCNCPQVLLLRCLSVTSTCVRDVNARLMFCFFNVSLGREPL